MGSELLVPQGDQFILCRCLLDEPSHVPAPGRVLGQVAGQILHRSPLPYLQADQAGQVGQHGPPGHRQQGDIHLLRKARVQGAFQGLENGRFALAQGVEHRSEDTDIQVGTAADVPDWVISGQEDPLAQDEPQYTPTEGRHHVGYCFAKIDV